MHCMIFMLLLLKGNLSDMFSNMRLTHYIALILLHTDKTLDILTYTDRYTNKLTNGVRVICAVTIVLLVHSCSIHIV